MIKLKEGDPVVITKDVYDRVPKGTRGKIAKPAEGLCIYSVVELDSGIFLPFDDDEIESPHSHQPTHAD